MKNKLNDLNNYLFEQIEKLNDEDLTEKELELTIAKANKIADISKVIIQNQALQLNAAKALLDYGKCTPDQFQTLIGTSDSKKVENKNA